MNANEKKSPAFSGLEQVSTLVFRIPKEELKVYYLKEAYLLEPHACSVNRTEIEMLNILMKKQKKILAFLSQISQFTWLETVIELQTACMPYLIENSVTKAERQKMSLILIESLQAASNVELHKDVIGDLTTIYNRHYRNVKALLSQYPESVVEE